MKKQNKNKLVLKNKYSKKLSNKIKNYTRFTFK